MGSETEFTKRLAKQGCKCYFQPKAVVRHIIRSNQLEPKWILERAFRSGRGIANQYKLKDKDKRLSIFGFPIFKLRILVAESIKVIILTFLRRPDKSFVHKWRLEFTKGWLHEFKQP